MHICLTDTRLIFNDQTSRILPWTLFNQIPIKWEFIYSQDVQVLRLSTLQQPESQPAGCLSKSRPIIEIAGTEAIEKARRLFARHGCSARLAGHFHRVNILMD